MGIVQSRSDHDYELNKLSFENNAAIDTLGATQAYQTAENAEVRKFATYLADQQAGIQQQQLGYLNDRATSNDAFRNKQLDAQSGITTQVLGQRNRQAKFNNAYRNKDLQFRQQIQSDQVSLARQQQRDTHSLYGSELNLRTRIADQNHEENSRQLLAGTYINSRHLDQSDYVLKQLFNHGGSSGLTNDQSQELLNKVITPGMTKRQVSKRNVQIEDDGRKLRAIQIAGGDFSNVDSKSLFNETIDPRSKRDSLAASISGGDESIPRIAGGGVKKTIAKRIGLNRQDKEHLFNPSLNKRSAVSHSSILGEARLRERTPVF